MPTARLKTILIAIWGLFFVLAIAIFLYFLTRNPGKQPQQTVTELNTLPAPAANTLVQTPISLTATPKTIFTPTPFPSNTPAATIPPLLPVDLPANYDPLTGLIPVDPSRLERRAMAVKITNFPRRVRGYQYGLTRADIAYEYYIEDGLTRFIAVFYGQDAEKAGPVRSGRYFDEHIARMYQAYLVFANADERVENFLLNSDLLHYLVVPTDNNCPPLCRDTKIQDYNNFFIDTAGLTEYNRKIGHETIRMPLRSTYFNILPPTWPLKIDRINIRYSEYSYHYWQYDSTLGLYLRYADAADSISVSGEVYQPHIDILTGQQITATNLVVLVVPHNFKTEFDRNDQVFDIQLLFEGQAYVFRDGLATVALWRRDQLDQPIRLVEPNGALVALKPGNTFYIVINSESSLVQTENSVRFTFNIPARRATATPTPPDFIPSPTPKKRP